MHEGRPEGRIALVVPLQDEGRTIVDLLASVGAQTMPPDEVILVDAGSRDDTVSRASAHVAFQRTRILTAGRVYPGVARNAGVAATSCEWIAFTDGGVVLDPHWLQELARQAGSGVDVVYGHFDPVCESVFQQCAATAYVPPRAPHGTRGPSTASCLLRRKAYEVIGGFPSYRAAEDLVFFKRLEEAGFRGAFAPRAVARWRIPETPLGVYRRFALYSYHNLLAGWGRHWHLGLARLYLVLGLVMTVAVAFGGLIWVWPILGGFFVARAAKSAWQKHGSFEFETMRPHVVIGTAGVLLVVDAGAFAGLGRWLSRRISCRSL
jgi:glycosyltransferase involved in cell wall biosynthesis